MHALMQMADAQISHVQAIQDSCTRRMLGTYCVTTRTVHRLMYTNAVVKWANAACSHALQATSSKTKLPIFLAKVGSVPWKGTEISAATRELHATPCTGAKPNRPSSVIRQRYFA
jgi:hypothetical protein